MGPIGLATAIVTPAVVFAATSDPQTWLDYVNTTGVLGMFIVLTWAVLKRKLVPGWTYDAMEADRNFYRDLATKGTEIADRQMGIAEALMERLETRAEREERLRSHARRRSDAEAE